MKKIDTIIKMTKLTDPVVTYEPKMMTVLFASDSGQSAISCGITKNMIKYILLKNEYLDSEFDSTDKLEPKCNRVYLISVLSELAERDHVFVIYINSTGTQYLFQSNCYTGQSLMDYYQSKNKYMGKKENSFEIDLGKIINKINNPNYHNVCALMTILNKKEFVLTPTEQEQMRGKKKIRIQKIRLNNDRDDGKWINNTLFYKKVKESLQDLYNL